MSRPSARAQHRQHHGPGLERRRLSPAPPEKRLTPALVLCWSADEPSRIGEIAFLNDQVSSTWLLGRGEPLPEDTAPRVTFLRQQSGRPAIDTGPLTSKALSRTQLRIRLGPNAIEITSIGQRALSLDGRPVEQGVASLVVPGTVVMLNGHSIFLVVQRPADLPRVLGDVARHDFGRPDHDGIVGESPAAWKLRAEIADAVRGRSHVFIHGASGTGKELAARAVHRLSGRRGPLVSFNAATVTVSLAESILFGNAANYPNPGVPERPGLFGQAEGGTLFLDEIGELGIDIQARVLRALEGDYVRLGEPKARHADVLVVAATNRDLSAIKHDVLKRFAFQIRMPSLAERLEDVPLLARALVLDAYRKNRELTAPFVRETAGGEGMEVDFDARLVLAMLRASYGGNVRDLRNLLLRAMTDTHAPPLAPPVDMSPWSPPPPRVARGPVDSDVDDLLSGIDPEAQRILAELDRQGGNVSRAAKELGISRDALNRVLKKLETKRRWPALCWCAHKSAGLERRR